MHNVKFKQKFTFDLNLKIGAKMNGTELSFSFFMVGSICLEGELELDELNKVELDRDLVD